MRRVVAKKCAPCHLASYFGFRMLRRLMLSTWNLQQVSPVAMQCVSVHLVVLWKILSQTPAMNPLIEWHTGCSALMPRAVAEFSIVTEASFFVKSAATCIFPHPPTVKKFSRALGSSFGSIPNRVSSSENSLPACFPASSQITSAPDPRMFTLPCTRFLNVAPFIKIQSVPAMRISPVFVSNFASPRKALTCSADDWLFMPLSTVRSGFSQQSNCGRVYIIIYQGTHSALLVSHQARTS